TGVVDQAGHVVLPPADDVVVALVDVVVGRVADVLRQVGEDVQRGDARPVAVPDVVDVDGSLDHGATVIADRGATGTAAAGVVVDTVTTGRSELGVLDRYRVGRGFGGARAEQGEQQGFHGARVRYQDPFHR